jgi:SAM-dependent methyltransferase
MKHEKILQLYDEHAKRCAPTDLLGQVRRTVGGEPVDERQIDFIVASVLRNLEIEERDVLLDLCCGNGLITNQIFKACSGGVGVDLGSYLIGIAKANFERLPERAYVVDDVEHFAATAVAPGRFTKALCYGSFMYISDSAAVKVLRDLHDRFENVTRVLLGNLPDKARLRDYFADDTYVEGIENDHEATTGRWRAESEICNLAWASGWDAAISRMPKGFFAAHYRFDVILTRKLHR